MSMAFVQREGSGPGGAVRFGLDLGSSRYFTYRIGPGDSVEEDGFALLADPSFVAPLAGPLPPQSLGRTVLDVPVDRFDRDNAYLQLISYKDAPDVGPTVSDLVHAGPAAGVRPWRDDGGRAMTQTLTYERTPARAVRAFALEERQFSEAMFLQALMPILQNVLPIVKDLLPMVSQLPGIGQLLGGGGGLPGLPGLGQLLGGGAAPGGQPAGGAPGGLPPLDKILDLVQKLIANFGQKPPASTGTPSLAELSGDKSWGGSGFSEAAIAPAVLAGLVQLAPLIEKALNPDTLKAIGQITPTGQANAANEQIRQHLEKILPTADTAPIYQLLTLLAKQESTRSLRSVMPDYSPAPGATLGFDAATLEPGIELRGRPRRLYRTDRACSFGLVIETPRPIQKPRLRWQVKLATSADVLIDEERELDAVTASGPLPLTPVLAPDEIAQLREGEEHVLCVYLLWKTSSGRTLGLNAMLPFTPVGEYCFDDVSGAEEGRAFALNDVDAHRDYWHKVWQATLSDEVFRYQYECKYYYGLDADADEPARGVTRVQDEPRQLHTQVGRLESSMKLSLPRLNALLPRLASDLTSLSEPELAALRNHSFLKRFDAAGRYEARFGGRRGTSVALWVFPELKLASVALKCCDDVDATGRVTAASTRSVPFPIPAAATFVGVTTET
jgi:hypothetical protein